jgi:poly(U)-specific endoribonuclease
VSGVFTWNSMAKCYGSMTVGTSPELEMALYTICFYARPEAKCKMSINNVPLLIQTFPLIYKSKTYVGTSYCDWN